MKLIFLLLFFQPAVLPASGPGDAGFSLDLSAAPAFDGPAVPAPAPAGGKPPPDMTPDPEGEGEKEPEAQTLAPLVDDSGLEVGLDAHVHLVGPENPGAMQNLRRALDDGLFRRAFLLSPAYLVAADQPPAAPFTSHLEQKRAYDLATASAVADSGGRLLGFCGLDTRFAGEDSLRATADCFRLPGMRGLKFRMASGILLAEAGNYGAARSAIAAGGSSVKMVLMHLDTYEHSRRDTAAQDYELFVAQDRAELDAAVRLMKEFPAVQFIIAHSAFGAPMVRYLAGRARAEGVSNHWIDTSHIIPAMREHPPTVGQPADPDAFDRAYAQAWRELGLGRVLFGSDILAGAEAGGYELHTGTREFLEEKLGVTNNPYLSAAEKQAILSGNGARLWSQVR